MVISMDMHIGKADEDGKCEGLSETAGNSSEEDTGKLCMYMQYSVQNWELSKSPARQKILNASLPFANSELQGLIFE